MASTKHDWKSCPVKRFRYPSGYCNFCGLKEPCQSGSSVSDICSSLAKDILDKSCLVAYHLIKSRTIKWTGDINQFESINEFIDWLVLVDEGLDLNMTLFFVQIFTNNENQESDRQGLISQHQDGDRFLGFI